jgi:hypothetical protein
MGVNATYRGNKVAFMNRNIKRVYCAYISGAYCCTVGSLFKKKKLIEVRPSPIFQPTPGGKFERNKREQKRGKNHQ